MLKGYNALSHGRFHVLASQTQQAARTTSTDGPITGSTLSAVATMLVVFATLSMGGCGDGQSQAQAQFQQARKTFQQANRGYTGAAEQGQSQPLEAYRLETLQQAEPPLNSVIQSNASDGLKQQARRLLAQIRAAQALTAAEQANKATEELRDLRAKMRLAMSRLRQAYARSGGSKIKAQPSQSRNNQGSGAGEQLMSQLFVSGGDQQQSQQQNNAQQSPAGSPSEEIAQAIQTLRTGPPQQTTQRPVGLKAQQQRVQQLSQQISQVQQKLSKVQQKAKQLQQQARQQLAKAQKIRNQAFDAEGEKEYKLLQKASELTSEGNDLSFEADRVQLEVTQLQRELDRLKTRRKLAQTAVSRLKKRIAKYEQRVQQIEKTQQQAAQQRRKAAQQVAKLAQQLQKHYQQNVQKPYAKANNRIQQSVKLMETAANQAGDDSAATYRVALVGHYLDRAHILSQHASALGSTVTGLAAMHQPKLLDQAAKPLDQAIGNLTKTYKRLGGQLDETVQAGVKVADAVSGADSQLAEMVKSQRRRLQQYQKMVASLAAAE